MNDSTELATGKVYLSDLDQTKGFEFDLVILLNCAISILPHPELPPDEAFRELCKLYVALTRAKAELVVSYSGSPTRFISRAQEHFNAGTWQEHEVQPVDTSHVAAWPKPAFSTSCEPQRWSVGGRDFLRLKDAVGLSAAAQDAILSCVTGRPLSRREAGRMKQREWPEFSVFFKDLQNVRNRVGVISTQAWDEIEAKYRGIDIVTLTDLSLESRKMNESRVPPDSPMKARIFYRHEGVSSYDIDLLSRYAVAAFAAAQEKSTVDELEVGRPMKRALLEFLVPKGAVRYWENRGWLRPSKTSPELLALTKSGWDRCREMEHKSVASPSFESLRQMILTGGNSPDRGRFAAKAF